MWKAVMIVGGGLLVIFGAYSIAISRDVHEPLILQIFAVWFLALGLPLVALGWRPPARRSANNTAGVTFMLIAAAPGIYLWLVYWLSGGHSGI